MSTATRCSLAVAVLFAAGSCKEDKAAETDRAGQELREAHDKVSENSQALARNQADIEQKKRDILSDQQALADKQKLLEKQQMELGSAQGQLQEARVAYAAAVKERLAKLDASLATLATKTDARSKDAATGLRARRDQLAAKLEAMAATPDASWNQYTKDVDVMFEAIERDRRDADK
jgi:chromosome segregation ATPase